MFNEENTVEQMALEILSGGQVKSGVAQPETLYRDMPKAWRFVPAEQLQREYSNVFVEDKLRAALIRINPEIAAEPERADEVIYKLRAIVMSVQGEGLVRANELFTEWLRGDKSMPFGERGEHTSVRLIDFETISNNEFIVTNQWVYPCKEGGRRLDVVLLINGMPVIIAVFRGGLPGGTSPCFSLLVIISVVFIPPLPENA